MMKLGLIEPDNEILDFDGLVRLTRICAATWNVGGLTPDDPNLDDWLDIDEPADVYVIG